MNGLQIVDCRLQIAEGHRNVAPSLSCKSAICNPQSAIRQAGFTLIELIITLAMLSIMISAVVPISRYTYKRQKEQQLKEDLRMLRQAIDRYHKFVDTYGQSPLDAKPDDLRYPHTLEMMVEGITPPNTVNKVRFLNRIPKDPMTGSTEWGLRSVQDEKDARSWGGQNVFDVYSKSDGIGLNGKKYSEW